MQKMNTTYYIIKGYDDFSGLYEMQKQTQTKPILPALVTGKIALSVVERPLHFALPVLECRCRGSVAEGPIKNIYPPLLPAISCGGPFGGLCQQDFAEGVGAKCKDIVF